jgi:GTPase SAR1 family protein
MNIFKLMLINVRLYPFVCYGSSIIANFTYRWPSALAWCTDARNIVVDGSAMNVRLWDIGGDSSLDELRDVCIKQAISDSDSGNTTLVLALCFDLCNRSTLTSLTSRYQSMINTAVTRGALLLGVGCKADLLPERNRVTLYTRYCPLPSALLPIIHSYLYWPHVSGGEQKRTCAHGHDIPYDDIQSVMTSVGCREYVECSARISHWHTKIMQRTSNPTLSLPSSTSSLSLFGSDVACVAHSSVHRVVKQAVRLARLKRGFVPPSSISLPLSSSTVVGSRNTIDNGELKGPSMIGTIDDIDDFEVVSSSCSGQRPYMMNNNHPIDGMIHGVNGLSAPVARSFADTRRMVRSQRSAVHAMHLHAAESLQFPSLDDD